jgi:hypothetical protein
LIENKFSCITSAAHYKYGKCNAAWLCAKIGTDVELKKLLEYSKEGLDIKYGEEQRNALQQAFLNFRPEYKLANVKLLCEYGADPNIFLW